jgi:hypothetical protein
MERTPELTELANLLYERIQDCANRCNRFEFDIPSNNPELEHFKAHIYFGLFDSKKKMFCGYNITSRKIANRSEHSDLKRYELYGGEDHELHELSELDEPGVCSLIADRIIAIDAMINGLVCDKLRGCFVDSKDERAKAHMQINRLVLKVFNHRKTDDHSKCCVCDDPTETKTKCKHHLCILCWNKLQKLTCPCCRTDISDVTNDSDSDED